MTGFRARGRSTASRWRPAVEVLDARTRRVSFPRDGEPLAYRDVLGLWQRDASFRGSFLAVLEEAPFEAYFWETPPVSAATAQREFEFVLVDGPSLAAMRPDEHAFAEHFACTDEDVVAFPNLGRDAFLVAPCPRAAPAAYPHLAAFARAAPEAQRHALWIAVGRTLERRLRERPIWLSTAGGGVAWVHVRLDSRPKYYSHAPYREPGG